MICVPLPRLAPSRGHARFELDRPVTANGHRARVAIVAAWTVGAVLALASPNLVVAANQSVKIVDFGFQPSAVTVTAGEVVTWQNTGSAEHTITADDGTFDGGPLAKGEQFAHLFDTAGTFAYHCRIHPSMTGTVTVKAAPVTPSPSGPLPPTQPPGTLPPNFTAHPAESSPPNRLSPRPPARDDGAPPAPSPSSDNTLPLVGLVVIVLATIAAGAWLALRRRAP